ncbi:hypothetical protein FB451DRAFT_459553 [Mycena latifolia]|nr:hypothetical protein FB451DRAFT_459553 [Mycena latifolia]
MLSFLISRADSISAGFPAALLPGAFLPFSSRSQVQPLYLQSTSSPSSCRSCGATTQRSSSSRPSSTSSARCTPTANSFDARPVSFVPAKASNVSFRPISKDLSIRALPSTRASSLHQSPRDDWLLRPRKDSARLSSSTPYAHSQFGSTKAHICASTSSTRVVFTPRRKDSSKRRG